MQIELSFNWRGLLTDTGHKTTALQYTTLTHPRCCSCWDVKRQVGAKLSFATQCRFVPRPELARMRLLSSVNSLFPAFSLCATLCYMHIHSFTLWARSDMRSDNESGFVSRHLLQTLWCHFSSAVWADPDWEEAKYCTHTHTHSHVRTFSQDQGSKSTALALSLSPYAWTLHASLHLLCYHPGWKERWRCQQWEVPRGGRVEFEPSQAVLYWHNESGGLIGGLVGARLEPESLMFMSLLRRQQKRNEVRIAPSWFDWCHQYSSEMAGGPPMKPSTLLFSLITNQICQICISTWLFAQIYLKSSANNNRTFEKKVRRGDLMLRHDLYGLWSSHLMRECQGWQSLHSVINS